MTTQQAIDIAKVQAFMGKVMADNASTVATVMAGIGDRLGLFKALAKAPATSTELAEHAHINERYAREWLNEMASADYLEYDPISERFTLPLEHVPVLAQEGGAFFLGWRVRIVDGRNWDIQPATSSFPAWWWCADGGL
jgi:winged helix-turn-helix protein